MVHIWRSLGMLCTSVLLFPSTAVHSQFKLMTKRFMAAMQVVCQISFLFFFFFACSYLLFIIFVAFFSCFTSRSVEFTYLGN